MGGGHTQQTVAGVSAGNWIPLDTMGKQPFAIQYAVVVGGSGATTYKVQGTLNDVLRGSAATAFDLVSAKTASYMGAQLSPIKAIRVNNTAGSAASTEMTVVQAL